MIMVMTMIMLGVRVTSPKGWSLLGWNGANQVYCKTFKNWVPWLGRTTCMDLDRSCLMHELTMPPSKNHASKWL